MKIHQNICKFLWMNLLIACTCSVGHAQLLWKVSGNKLKNPSYLLGTHHFMPLSLCDTLSGFDKAFSSSKQFYGEISFADSANTKAFDNIPKMELLPKNQSLADFYTPEEYEEILQYTESIIGYRPRLITFTPGAFYLFLTITFPETQSSSKTEYIDDGLQRRALADGKAVGGLESVELGANLLWGGDMKKDAAKLLETVRDPANSKDSLASARLLLDKAYSNQNLDLLYDMVKQGLDEDEYQDFVSKRNLSWLPIMEEAMKKCCTFFAVGGGHLPGEEGLITLLRKQGYTVEPVK